MTELKFPKRPTRKKRKQHPASILQADGSYCYLCAYCWGDFTPKQTECHHIFPGTALRRISEENGFTVRLCRKHHEGDETGSEFAVHRPDKNVYSIALQRECQMEYEKTHSREEWMALMGRSYVDG